MEEVKMNVAQENVSEKTETKLEKAALKQNASLVKELRKGRNRHLGPVELLSLKAAGYSDGKIGIPKLCDNGEWTSAFIMREVGSFSEYCDRLWGKQQVDLHWAHRRCDTLFDEMLKLNRALLEAKANIKPGDPSHLTIRKRGEEALTEAQVHARRAREAAKMSEKSRSGVHRIQAQIDEKYQELSLVYNFIKESDNIARLICERVMNHTKQRIAVYWRSAYKVHPESTRMPVAVSVEISSDAEATYMAKHAEKDSSIAALLSQYETGHTAETLDIKEVA